MSPIQSTTRALLGRLLLASAVLLIAACGRESDARSGGSEAGTGFAFEENREAPAFALETLDGDSLTLASLDSVPVILLNFWASWCGPCKIEIPDLMALDETYGPEGFMVLGVTVNDLPRDSRDLAAEVEMSYPSVIGTPRMLESYGISPWLPTSLLVKDGRIVEQWVGPRTKEEFEYPIKVALGLAPAAEDLMADEPAAQGGDGR